ncbi:MAG: GGDEF domain-containing protein [Sulfurospirillum sp.]|nr:GGDEF domain-containing protein [Sulfurospirillum sp.]
MKFFISDAKDLAILKETMQELSKNPDEVRSILVTFEGKKELLGVAYLKEIDWFSLTLIDAKELSLINQSALVPILSLFFLLSLIFVGYVLHSLVLNPIAKIKAMMKRIEDGEYNLQVSIVGKAEIADLAKQFQTMVKFIQNYNAKLEEKVKARTIELERSQDCIKQLAFYDPLTNLPNRRLLSERFNLLLAQIKRNSNYGALMVLDVDDFKPINDRYGHLAGDELLKQIALRVKSWVRENDTVARFGGDEFSILLDALDTDAKLAKTQSIAIAQKIQDICSKPYQLADTICTCSLSIGITLICKDDQNMEQIFERADKAMYSVKQSSKNAIHFFE